MTITCTTTPPIYTTTTPPPPTGPNCLRAFWVCDCGPRSAPVGPEKWVLQTADCVSSRACSGLIICTPLMYYREYPSNCVIGNPPVPPAVSGCTPICCPPGSPTTTTTTTTTTPPPVTADCQSDFSATCAGDAWAVGVPTSVCVNGCVEVPWTPIDSCAQAARTCAFRDGCTVGQTCSNVVIPVPSQPTPDGAGNVPACCTGCGLCMDPVFLNFGTIAIPSGCASYAIPDLPLTGYLSNTGTGGPPCAYTGIFSLYFDGTVEVVAAVALSYAAGQWGLGVTLTITDSSVPTSYQIFTLWMLTSANECNPSGGYDLSIVDSQCGDISWPGANPSVSLPS